MRVAVTGARSYADADAVARALSALPPDAVLVHGAAPGADSLCATYWAKLGRLADPHPARWEDPCRATCKPGHRRIRYDGADYCPAAGVYRNQEMVDSGLDLLIAFPGGTGTADMVQRCKDADVNVEFAGTRP